jgi:flagellar biosynthetic protein FlhB
MADEEFGDKQHEATPQRREQAREEGNVVKSQDLGSAALLVGGLLTLWYMGNGLAVTFGRITKDHLGGEAWMRIDVHDFLQRLVQLCGEVSLALLPI